MPLLEALTDQEELNRMCDADPALAANMSEMGFIKRVPFQLNHNQHTVAQWAWTEYGRREMMQRIDSGAEFFLGQGGRRQ